MAWQQTRGDPSSAGGGGATTAPGGARGGAPAGPAAGPGAGASGPPGSRTGPGGGTSEPAVADAARRRAGATTATMAWVDEGGGEGGGSVRGGRCAPHGLADLGRMFTRIPPKFASSSAPVREKHLLTRVGRDSRGCSDPAEGRGTSRSGARPRCALACWQWRAPFDIETLRLAFSLGPSPIKRREVVRYRRGGPSRRRLARPVPLRPGRATSSAGPAALLARRGDHRRGRRRGGRPSHRRSPRRRSRPRRTSRRPVPESLGDGRRRPPPPRRRRRRPAARRPDLPRTAPSPPLGRADARPSLGSRPGRANSARGDGRPPLHQGRRRARRGRGGGGGARTRPHAPRRLPRRQLSQRAQARKTRRSIAPLRRGPRPAPPRPAPPRPAPRRAGPA